MSFVFRCPNCHAEHTAASSIAGRKVRCPDCFEVVEAVASDDPIEQSKRNLGASDTVVLTATDIVTEPAAFDPYQQWLGIPPEDQPPNFYRLLDLPVFEPDSYVISGAADRQTAKLSTIEDQQQDHLKVRLIEELKRARQCLTDPEQRAAYDRRLHKQIKKSKSANVSPVETEATDDSETRQEAVAKPQTGPTAGEAAEPAESLSASSTEAADQVDQAFVEETQQTVPSDADASSRPTVAPPPKIAPPPIIRPVEGLNADLGVRALMHVDAEDEEGGGDTFVNFAENRTEFESEMDMTPMVDVTFLLLIFFMVTASFSLQKSIEQPVQKQDEPSTNVTQQEFEDNPDYVVVQIDEFDTFRVIAADFDEEAPSEQELLIKLRRARDGRGGRVPTKLLVSAHGDASHGRVIMAMDAGTEVGMEQVQFTLAAEDDF